jgi:hypothetical protein
MTNGGWGSGWDNQAVVEALAVIIASGIPGAGLFEYNGTPGPGNPPVAWAVTPGTTVDPFGNALPASGGFITENIAASVLAQLFSGALNVGTAAQFAGTGGAFPGHVGMDSTFDPGTLLLGSGAASSTDAQAFWILASDTAAGGAGQNQVRTSSTLVLLPNTNPPQLAGAGLFGDANGVPRAKLGTGTPGDPNNYFMAWSRTAASAVPQTISSTSATLITGCSFSVGAGLYLFRARVTFSGGSAAGTANFSVSTSGGISNSWINAVFTMSSGTAGSGAQNAARPCEQPDADHRKQRRRHRGRTHAQLKRHPPAELR